jgi:branched-chain amino acid transport system ATP-binding protein
VSEDGAPLLRLDRVSRRFGGLVAVDGLSFAVPPARVTALIGPNGAGKTTVFNLISGLLRPHGGSVVFDGADITGRRPQAIARQGLVRTFQLPSVFGRMTVLENLEVVGGRGSQGRALALLERAHLADVRHEYAGDLSYGQQKLIDVVRALMLAPRLILLDEPAAGLGRTEQERLFAFLDELRAAGCAFLVIEHQMHLVRDYADRVIVLNFGRKLAEGPYAEIRTDERVLDVYFGR